MSLGLNAELLIFTLLVATGVCEPDVEEVFASRVGVVFDDCDEDDLPNKYHPPAVAIINTMIASTSFFINTLLIVTLLV